MLDTVVFVQGLIGGRGPAARCIEEFRAGRFILMMSEALLEELQEVPLRPELVRRYSRLTQERVGKFVQEIERLAVMVQKPARAMALPRDPEDESGDRFSGGRRCSVHCHLE